jgi:hypothetical protein
LFVVVVVVVVVVVIVSSPAAAAAAADIAVPSPPSRTMRRWRDILCRVSARVERGGGAWARLQNKMNQCCGGERGRKIILCHSTISVWQVLSVMMMA